MALDAKIILLVALATVVMLTISVSAAQQTKTDHGGVELPQKTLPKFADGLYFHNPDVSLDYSTIDNKFLKEFMKSHDLEISKADLDRQYGRNWPFAAATKASQYMAENKGVDGLVDTPLGDISQQCSDDVMTFFTDFEALQTYALKSKCL